MNQLAVENKPKGLRAWLDIPSVKTGIKNALGGWMNEDSFIAQLVISLNDQSLDECSEQSKFEAAHLCAALGMLPSLQQVALIPRNSKKHGCKICTVMPQWQGFQALMLRNDDVLDVNAELVHINDEYEFDPVTRQLKHKYDPFDDDRAFKSFDDIKGGYLVVKWRDKTRPDKFHFVTKKTMTQARDCSPDYQRNSNNGAIWIKWFMEQCLKTVYRNTYARRVIPIDPLVAQKLEKAVQAEDIALENDPMRIAPEDQSPVIETARIEKPASRSQQVAQSMETTSHQEPCETTTTAPPVPGQNRNQQAKKPRDNNGLHVALKDAIDSNNPDQLADFQIMAENSLAAGAIDQGVYDMLTEQASNAMEQAGAPT